MPTAPDDPGLRRWLPRQPVEADRLDRWQGQTVMNISVTGGGAKTQRKGNSFAVQLPRVRRTPPGTAMFPVYITSAAGPGALYNGTRLDMSGAIAINPSVGTITPEMVGKSDGTPIYVVNLTELGLSTHDLSVGPVNVVMFAAWWHPLPATDGARVALTWGFDWFRCSQGVTAAELNFI